MRWKSRGREARMDEGGEEPRMIRSTVLYCAVGPVVTLSVAEVRVLTVAE